MSEDGADRGAVEADKLAGFYEDRIKSMEEAHRGELERLLHVYELRIGDAIRSAGEKVKTLEAQNDGMLGAIGRVHAENEDLKARLLQADEQIRRLNEIKQNGLIEAQAAISKLEEEIKRLRRKETGEKRRKKAPEGA